MGTEPQDLRKQADKRFGTLNAHHKSEAGGREAVGSSRKREGKAITARDVNPASAACPTPGSYRAPQDPMIR